MNPEQICDLFAGLNQANGSLVRIADSLESVTDDGLPTGIVNPLLGVVDVLKETNERLENIDGSLAKIANALEKIANIFEMKETRSFTLKVENCFDPSNGLFASQEPESVDEKEE